MARFVIALFCLFAFTSASLLDEEFEAFKLQYNKKYNHPKEEYFRKQIYGHAKLNILKHNQKYHRGEVSYKLGVNKNADKLPRELIQRNGLKMHLKSNVRSNSTFMKFDKDIGIPSSMDWRTKGAVTPVKDQGQCGSCWAFSTTGSLEGQHFRKTGKLVSLSEQNLVDCSSDNSGCDGGLMDVAFQFIYEEGGLDTEASYPYEAEDDDCRFSKVNIGADDQGFTDIPEGDEEALKHAVATVGPISVAIDASHDSFMYYQSGVYSDDDCSSTTLDHGVLVVGYGTDPQEGDYWIVKNSWASDWGENGYIRMARNQNNMCGIASMASYPIV